METVPQEHASREQVPQEQTWQDHSLQENIVRYRKEGADE